MRLTVRAPTSRPHRKHPVHYAVVDRRDGPIIVFVTVCSADRKPIFANAPAAQAITEAWRRADAWLVGRYVMMPDHVHLFSSPVTVEVPLSRWVAYWKSVASRRWPRPVDQPIWQIDFWDTQLRAAESYASKWEYVRHNPVRHGLVKNPDGWPYQGEMNVLPWNTP